MKKSKVLLIVILCIFVFLICDKIRISANLTTSSKSQNNTSNTNIEDLINYINNLELTKDDVDEISEKGKNITEAIKGKTSFKEYNLKEILSIYKNFNSIANKLNLKIDFSMKSGDFSLKDKTNREDVFSGNIGDIKNYFKAIKENTNITTLEVYSSIFNTELLENLNEIINNNNELNIISDTEINKEELNNEEIKQNEITDNNKLLDHNANNSENAILIKDNSNSDMIIPITILVVTFFIIIIAYIKFK